MNNNTGPTGIPVLDYQLWCEQVGIEPFGEESNDDENELENNDNNNLDKKKQLKRKDDKYE